MIFLFPPADISLNIDGSTRLAGSSRDTGVGIKFRQFGALLKKRFNHGRRDPKGWLSAIIMPLLFVALAMACSLIKPENKILPALQMTPTIYGPKAVSFFK